MPGIGGERRAGPGPDEAEGEHEGQRTQLADTGGTHAGHGRPSEGRRGHPRGRLALAAVAVLLERAAPFVLGGETQRSTRRLPRRPPTVSSLPSTRLHGPVVASVQAVALTSAWVLV